MTLLHGQQHRANEPLDRRSICCWGVVRRQVHSARLNVDIIYSWASKERRVDSFRRALPSVSADQRHGTAGRHVASSSSSCCCCCCCRVCTVWNITSLNHRRSTNRYIFVRHAQVTSSDKLSGREAALTDDHVQVQFTTTTLCAVQCRARVAKLTNIIDQGVLN